MSLPILLGSKSVSSRPLLVHDEHYHDEDFVAEDGMTPLHAVPVPDCPTMTATAICPLDEWLAFVTVTYFDMMMVAEEDDDDDDESDSSNDIDLQLQEQLPSTRRKLARHSVVAQVQIQISPLALPYSSAYRTVTHRLTLPHYNGAMTTATSATSPKRSSFLDDRHLRSSSSASSSSSLGMVQPNLVFSSDRQTLACLIPYPRQHQHRSVSSTGARRVPQQSSASSVLSSILVAFPLERPTQQFAPPKLPKLPSYISTGSSSSNNTMRPKQLPQALRDPEWLQLPSHSSSPGPLQGGLLHSITSMCIASTIPHHHHNKRHRILRHDKGSSTVILAGCWDGSIVGISFHPLRLAGQLYHPNNNNNDRDGDGNAITFLSHITTTQQQPMVPPSSATTDNGNNGDLLPEERDVLGKLVAIQESGRALFFQSRMVLSPLITTQDENNSLVYDSINNGSSSHFMLDENASEALYHDNHHDQSDTASDHYGVNGGDTATGVVIHGESFQVTQKPGRRNSLPANTRFAASGEGGDGRLTEPLLPLSDHQQRHQKPTVNVVGNTGLLMFLEFLDGSCTGNPVCSNSISRAEWITGSLLAVLEKPTDTSKKRASSDAEAMGTANTYRVAQVWAIPLGKPPEILTELTLTTEDLSENAHTRFALTEGSDDGEVSGTNGDMRLNEDASNLLRATYGIQYDAYSGCLTISSARISSSHPSTLRNRNSSKRENPPANQTNVRVFVSLWHWRSNTLGFTAVSTSSLESFRRHFPISQLLLTRARSTTNARRAVHLHSVDGKQGCERLRKDLYEIGFLSPPEDTRRNSALDGMRTCPLLLTSSSVTFPLASHSGSHSTEVEWQEADFPVPYRLEYGSPTIAAISTGGRSVAVASSRGLCVLDCSPRPKKSSVVNDRTFMFETSAPPAIIKDSQCYGLRHRLPPKWHLFGNETEEKAFRVLTMTWWQGNQNAKRHHASDDLLVAVVQLLIRDTESGDPAGTCYLACWSQRRLDTAHQRLRPLDPNLQSSRCHWGVRIPEKFRVKSAQLLPQPNAGSSALSGKRERKAVVMLSSTESSTGKTRYIVSQLQVISSVGRTQSSGSYVESHPYSVLSQQASTGEITTGTDDTGSTVFLASASFQFDLRQKMRLSSGTGEKANEIVGTIGVIKSPGIGIDALVLTNSGPSRITAILDKPDSKHEKIALRSSEVSSYWLSDFIPAQRTLSTTQSEIALLDFYAWTFQLGDGKILTWFVPCLQFVLDVHAKNRSDPQRGISSRTMLGIVCPNGISSTWLQRSPTKTGKDFMVGCVPHSPHGCVLSTGQSSRKFHRTIAGGFDHSLFAADFMEHEFLYARDLELSPPAFMSSTAALAKTYASFLVLNLKSTNGSKLFISNPGGSDAEKALLSVDLSDHVRTRSQPHQDAAFMALRLLVLRSVEQLSDDARQRKSKTENPSLLSASVLAEVLQIVRSCSTSRLQFTSLILEVGRQLEPSCFPQLFPLPSVTPSVMAKGEICALGPRTIAAFFDACIEDGSLISSVSSLPILSARDRSQQKCKLLLEHCLEGFKENSKSENDLFFDFSLEQRSALGDIFRFGAKLEDSNGEDFLDFHLDQEIGHTSASDNSGDNSDSDDDSSRRKSYSIACGIFNLSWFRSKAPVTKQKSRPATEKARSTMDDLQIGTMAGSVAKVLVQMTVSVEHEPHQRTNGWKRSAALAALLVCQGESTLPRLSPQQCFSLCRQVGGFHRKKDLKAMSLQDGITSLLKRCMVECSTEISPRSAGKILDLVLILLARAKTSSDFDSLLPGLLVIGITAGDASNHIDMILDVNEKSASFTQCYLRAIEGRD